MELRTLGSSGVSISRVCLGGLELRPETDEEPSVDRAVHVIETAVEVLATKVAHGAGVTGGGTGFQREQVHQACRNSLRRLGPANLDLEGVLDELEPLITLGPTFATF